MKTPILIILLIYYFIISAIINKKTKRDTSITFKSVLINFILIAIVTFMATIIISYLAGIYSFITPDSKSETCSNLGGLIYLCKGKPLVSAILFLIMELIIVLHHFICIRLIYDIFKYKNIIIKFLIMFLYMACISYLNLLFLISLYGIFIITHYELAIVAILRFIVATSPSTLFIISTIIYCIKNKNN